MPFDKPFSSKGSSMQKPVPAGDMQSLFVHHRWSPYAFSDQPVPGDVLRAIFEAARWAPSSSNLQPWTYIVATKENPAEFDKLRSVLVEFNATWTKHGPVLAISVARVKNEKDGQPNRLALHDVGSATAQLTAEAVARGLFVHQMAGFDSDKARKTYNIPDGWEPVAAIALGYPGDPQSLPDKLRERELGPRVRKPLAEFVMSDTWGHTASFIPK
jgi:nitroreductase